MARMCFPPVAGGRDALYFRRRQERTSFAPSIKKDTVVPRTPRQRLDCSPGCAVEATLRFIDGKWKGVILWHLLAETLRFNRERPGSPPLLIGLGRRSWSWRWARVST